MISQHIIQHIVKSFGVPGKLGGFTLLDEMYKLPERLTVDIDGVLFQKNIWGAQGQIGGSSIKLIAVDLSIDDDKEYILSCQLDDLTIYILRYNNNDNDLNKAYCLHNNATWVELTNLVLARLLVGVEQINELFVNYKPFEQYQDFYDHLMKFFKNEE